MSGGAAVQEAARRRIRQKGLWGPEQSSDPHVEGVDQLLVTSSSTQSKVRVTAFFQSLI